ncbi:MAG: 16S rRNA (adenine(1518)-N(6)/adenine(1519)-N(6))-dimethyltransferase RsmA [Anaerovoracaceae bacterium]|jgi:16S rRNA (adenine1518-N6/adenine1519-N6)-dimethyltransferase
MKLYAPSNIKKILQENDLRPTKSLGQNFLADKNIIDNIIQKAGIGQRDLVIEIGPGLGVITRELCERAGMVLAVEIDRQLIPILDEELQEYTNKKIIQGDILKVDLLEHIHNTSLPGGESPEEVKVVANLPYYITTPILMRLLEDRLPLASITVMMQKEVAERLLAKPGTKEYGAITLAVQYYGECNILLSVPKEVFVPQPKVDSTVVQIRIHPQPRYPEVEEAVLFGLIKAAFGKRRKTLLNALTGVFGLSKEEIKSLLETAGIQENRRGETLSLDEYAGLSQIVRKTLS